MNGMERVDTRFKRSTIKKPAHVNHIRRLNRSSALLQQRVARERSRRWVRYKSPLSTKEIVLFGCESKDLRVALVIRRSVKIAGRETPYAL